MASVPPRVRAAIKLLEKSGYVFVRQGKGDHRIFERPGDPIIVLLDGGDNEELASWAWDDIQKRCGLKGKGRGKRK